MSDVGTIFNVQFLLQMLGYVGSLGVGSRGLTV